MTKRSKLTTNQSEDEIAALMSHDAVFVIPFFQRPYKWRPERVKRFHADLIDLVENANDFHFLGAIITHERKADPAEPRQIEVIDGQQRVTTIFLYLCAIVRELCTAMRYEEAKRLFFDHLVARRKAAASNIRLHSCLEDRAQLNWIFETLLGDDGFVAALGKFSLQELQTNGSSARGQLKKNFQQICCLLQTERKRGGIARVREIYSALAQRITVVRLELFNPLNGPKIFDSLNSRQEPMTIGELVRNEIFSRVGDEDAASLALVDKSHWQPFYRKFHQAKKNLFDEYFFPYGLIHNPNLKKSGVYSALRESWAQDKSPEQVIKKLMLYQDPFIDIRTGSNLSRHDARLSLAFRRLYELGAPSSVLPFFMRLSVAVSDGKLSVIAAVRIAEVIESFLVRRAVCGYEPTGLHAVFKRLWLDCGASPTAARVAGEIARHKTVPWPADNDFKAAILTRPLYGAAVTRFLIAQHDKDLGGDAPSDIPFIEHILPQTLTPGWRRVFPEEVHAEMKDLLGNLLPLSGAMNASLGNRPFHEKKRSYLEDSMFKSSRQFARGVEKWTPKELNARGVALAGWALRRWPHAK